MDWIKKNYDQFAVALLALTLLVFSGLIIFKALGFNDTFAATQSAPARNDKISPIEKGPVEDANQSLEKPVTWSQQPQNGSLFVSWKYLIDPTTKLPMRLGGTKGQMLHPPVPDEWLIKHDLDVLSPTVLQDDPDKDHFSNLDEYLGADRKVNSPDPEDSTDPRDDKSHPPYYTKLFLKEYIKVKFRLLFNAFDGDPKKPETWGFQINTLDLRQPTVFLKLGESVPNTKFKLEKFEAKTQINKKTEAEEDVSELTLLNTETNDHVILVITKITDSPDSYALFTYIWPQPSRDIRVKKLQEFVLIPNTQEKYKLIDIKETEAQIALPSGEKYTVPVLPK